jgi:hypothetical protein
VATYVICEEDLSWNTDMPVAEWKRSMIEALANTLVKVAREGTDEQRELMKLTGQRLISLTINREPKTRRRRSTT